MQFSYKITDLKATGLAIVEYRHVDLGVVIKHIVLHYDKTPEIVIQEIKNNFPAIDFYMRKQALEKPIIDNIPWEGEFESEIEPSWLSTTVETVEAIKPED